MIKKKNISVLFNDITSILLLSVSIFLCFVSTISEVDFSVLSISLSAICGIYLFLSILLGEVRLLIVIASATLNGYANGFLNTYFFAPEFFKELTQSYFLQDMNTAIIVLNIYCLVLIILSKFFKFDTIWINQIQLIIKKDGRNIHKILKLFCLFVAVIQIYLIASGQTSLSATGARFFGSEEGVTTFNIFTAIGFYLSNLSPLLIGVLIGTELKTDNNRFQSYLTKYYIYISCFFWLFIAGRSIIVIGLITAFIGYKLTKTNIELNSQLKSLSLKKIISILLLVFIIYYTTNFIGFLRFYAPTFGASIENNVVTFVFSAFLAYLGFLFDPSKLVLLREFDEAISDNIATRTFIFGFLLLVVHTLSNRQPLMGQDISSNFLLALPSDIFVDKSKVLVNENLYNYVYNLAVPDIANSYLTSAFLDFSWLGLVIYPLFIYLIFNALIKLVLNNNSILINLALLANLLRVSFKGAEGSTSGTLADIRQFLLFYLLVYAYQRLFPHKKI